MSGFFVENLWIFTKMLVGQCLRATPNVFFGGYESYRNPSDVMIIYDLSSDFFTVSFIELKGELCKQFIFQDWNIQIDLIEHLSNVTFRSTKLLRKSALSANSPSVVSIWINSLICQSKLILLRIWTWFWCFHQFHPNLALQNIILLNTN